ncbi:MAG TPA: hypothetical protein VNH83_26010 [Bryobacteraceae bacterium]|nr:hypothetical protein [Bryobacteraceae bacterium]
MRFPALAAICAIAWSVVRIADAVIAVNIKECREWSSLPLILWAGVNCVVFNGGKSARVPELLHWELVTAVLIVIAVASASLVAPVIERAKWILGALMAECVYWFGMHQFGGYDFAVTVESAYRVLQGQIPYRDFFCSLPPLFFLPAAMAFRLFGVHWYALQILAAVFAFVTFYWLAWLFRKSGCEHPVLAALAIEVGSMVSLSFWWYNNVTAIVAAIFALSCFAWERAKDPHWTVRASFCASMAMLALAKPNTAALILLAGFIYVLRVDRTVIVETVLAAVIAVSALSLHGISVGNLFADYLMVATARGTSDPWIGWRINGLDDNLRAFVQVSIFLTALIAGWKSVRWLSWVCVAVALLAMTTNGEMKEVDCALLVVAVAVSCHDGKAKRFAAMALTVLIFCGFYMGLSRYRVATIGEHRFHEYSQDEVQPPTAFFKGFYGSGTLKRTIEQAELAAHVGPKFCNKQGLCVDMDAPNVFYGPRLEWMYAATGRKSPAGLPIWWDPVSAFPKETTDSIIQRWQDMQFDTLIFCRWDAPFYEVTFGRAILDGYYLDNRYSELTVFRRKTKGSL